MKAGLLLWCALGLTEAGVVTASETLRGDLVIVVGSPGSEEYRPMFADWADKWRQAGERGHLRVTLLSPEGMTSPSLEEVRHVLRSQTEEDSLPLWLVFIGHGTFDGRSANFNLPGPDLSAEELATLLSSLKRPLAFINCTSASAPFLEHLAGPNRVIITSTKSGAEVNLSRFGGFLADSLVHPEADLDKDGQVSLLESFLRGARLTEEFYTGDGRLATEHPVLDDNGDGRPVPLNGFEGLRSVQREQDPDLAPDGVVAQLWVLVPGEQTMELPPELQARRVELERQIAQLRARKEHMEADAYYAALEPLFIELAKLILHPDRSRGTPEGVPATDASPGTKSQER